jgi:predicted transcriptional regulator
MAAITLRPTTWNKLVALAKRQQQNPEQLAERAVRDFLTRMADEELLANSRRQAQRNGKTIREIEEGIKERRRTKR